MFFYVFAVCVIVIFGGLGYVYLRRNILNPGGKGAENITAGTLKRFGVIRRFKVLSNVEIAHGGKSAVIENMLIGYFGILIVTTCGRRGEYYGTPDGENWIVTYKQQRFTIPNPILQQQRSISILRAKFAQNKLYNIPVENLVVFTDKGKDTAVFVSGTDKILLSGKLRGYLSKSKFEQDIGLDVEQVANVLTGAAK